MTGNPERDYVIGMLQLDANQDVSAFMERRQRFLQLPVYAPDTTCVEVGAETRQLTDSMDEQERESNRFELAGSELEQLQRLSQDFWKADPEVISLELSKMSQSSYPEIVSAANHLQAVHAVRGPLQEFESSLQKRRFGKAAYQTFVMDLRRLVTLPVMTAAGMKERRIRELWKGDLSRTYRRAARALVTQFPELLVFDKEWIEQIANYPKGCGYRGTRVTGAKIQWLILTAVAVTIVLVVILAIIIQ